MKLRPVTVTDDTPVLAIFSCENEVTGASYVTMDTAVPATAATVITKWSCIDLSAEARHLTDVAVDQAAVAQLAPNGTAVAVASNPP